MPSAPVVAWAFDQVFLFCFLYGLWHIILSFQSCYFLIEAVRPGQPFMTGASKTLLTRMEVALKSALHVGAVVGQL